MSGWHKPTKAKAITGAIDLSANLKICLTRATGYTVDLTHEFLSSVTNILGTSEALTGITTTNGIIDCNDTQTAATVGAGAAINQAHLYKDTGNAATSPLVYSYTTGINYAPDGNKIGLTIDPSGLCEI